MRAESSKLKATRWKRISAIASVVSVCLLVATLTLPYVKIPETARQRVFPVTNGAQNYQVYGYGIPPVSAGSEITVNLTGFAPRALQYSLSPTSGNLLLHAIALGRVGNGTSYSFSALVQGTYSLELTIIAYNGSGYSITYSGVWSPFNDIQVYLSPVVFILIASLAATYYFGTRIGKQLNEEAVERELAESRSRTS